MKTQAPGSLRAQLLRWLIGPLVLLVLLNTVSVYHNALNAADNAYDRSLLASTRALAERLSVQGGKLVADIPYLALDSFETDTLGRIYYKVSGIRGEHVAGFEDLPPVPRQAPRSEAYPALVRFYDATYNGQALRIAALQQPVYDASVRGIALIQVGETRDARRELSRQILLDTLMREALMVLAVASLVWFAVRLVLRPLMRLRDEVATRPTWDLSNVDPHLVHREVRPLVQAMNGAMARLQQLIASQRRFIADASHQLRTPLAVLKTQAELAAREHDIEAMRRIVLAIAATTDHSVQLANRLLMLARIEHGDAQAAPEPVVLAEVARQVGSELALPALEKGLDLSLDAQDDGRIRGHWSALHEMLVNLVDNAIRYTPKGGQVKLQVRRQQAMVELVVEDTGIGIPASERDKVFSPFYRGSNALDTNPGGAGLGLAIVQEVAEHHGATVRLEPGSSGAGLRVCVQFKSDGSAAPQ